MDEDVIQLPAVTWQGAAVAGAVLLAALVLAWVLRHAVGWVLRRRGRGASSSVVFGRLTGWAVVVLGVAVALTVVFPSVKPVNVLGGVGVISIAAGIAFQTVLGNTFAGIILLARDRFRVGDQIECGQHRGTVVQIGLSSTSIRTFDGRLVLIPNGTLHSEVVTVQTGFEYVRSTVGVDLEDTTDLDVARSVALEAMADLPSVLAEPVPEALLTSIGNGTVRMELRFWSGSTQLDTREAQHAVIREVLREFDAAGVRTGSDAYVVEAGPALQSALRERASGDRSQREGSAVLDEPGVEGSRQDRPRHR